VSAEKKSWPALLGPLLVFFFLALCPMFIIWGSAASPQACKALVGDTKRLLKLVAIYELLVVVVPLGGYLGLRLVRRLDRLRVQVLRHADSPGNLPLVSVEGNDEIAELASAFNRLLGALAERNRQNEDFMASVAHEMKNPIAAVRACAESIHQRGSLEASRAQKLARVLLDSSVRLDALVTHFLDLARADAGLPNEERVRVEIDRLVQRLVGDLSLDERFRFVRFEVDADPVAVIGVPGRLESVVRNLLDNAAHFASLADSEEIITSPGHPTQNSAEYRALGIHWVRVRVRRSTDGTMAVVRVSDSGPGIPAEHLPKIFQRFFTSRSTGTGIGLAMSRAIVEAHGGILNAESPKSSGAVFTVRLPTAEYSSRAALETRSKTSEQQPVDSGQSN